MPERRIGELFMGVGRIGAGLLAAQPEWSVAWGCEADPFRRALMAQRHPDAVMYPDVTTLNAAEVEPVTVLAAGFPCQDLSGAGKGAGMAGERSGLWAHCARLIGELDPDYVVIENVPILLVRGATPTLGYGGGFERVLADLHALGYDCEWDCIPAAAVGAPHLRDRVWIVAHRRAAPPNALGGAPLERVAHFDAEAAQWLDPQASLFGAEPVVRWPRAGRLVGAEVLEAVPLAPMAAVRGTAPWPTPRVASERTGRDALTAKHWSAPGLAQAVELADGVLPREYHAESELTPQARRLYEMGRATRYGESSDTPEGYWLPTPTKEAYGSSNNGVNAGRPATGKGSLHTLAARGEVDEFMPTPRASDPKGADLAREENRSGARHSGDDLPTYVERWPTPTGQDGANNGGPSQFDRNSLPLNAAVKAYPTPMAADGEHTSEQGPRHYAEGGDNPTLLGAARRAEEQDADAAQQEMWPTPTRMDAAGSRNATCNRPGGSGEHHSGTTLTDALILNGDMEMPETGVWPTPEASDGSGGRVAAEMGGERPSGAKRAVTLGTAVAHDVWPTPKASPSGPDYAREGREESGGDDLATAVDRRTKGALNPDWTDWLMGMPIGWTDPDCAEPEPHPGFHREPEGLPRVAQDVPHRSKRLAADGDSVVSQCVTAFAGALR